MAQREPTILTRNVNKGVSGLRISEAKYSAVKKAILKAVPRGKEGIRFLDLPSAVAANLTREARANLGSINWYTTVVKLDLEARRLIERIPGAKPQRIRRLG